MKIKVLIGATIFCFQILFSFDATAQSTNYYIGWEEPSIRKDIAARNIKDLVTDYSVDGQKVMAWRDLDLRTSIIILFDDLGKGKSCTFLPFSEKDIYEFKVLFNKNHKILEKNVWISTIGNRSFKIIFQFVGGIFSRYGFIIYDYDQERRTKQLDDLIKSLEPLRSNH